MITFEELRNNAEICAYGAQADKTLAALGFTEHSFGHVCKVAETAGYILETMDRRIPP